MKRKKEKLDKRFSPEKYKMACRPYCKGTGKSSEGDKGVKVCTQCGGFGWIKKGEDPK